MTSKSLYLSASTNGNAIEAALLLLWRNLPALLVVDSDQRPYAIPPPTCLHDTEGRTRCGAFAGGAQGSNAHPPVAVIESDAGQVRWWAPSRLPA